MVISSNGEILTNNHVIAGATSISVQIGGTGTKYTAEVVGYDTTDDVAVLQIARRLRARDDRNRERVRPSRRTTPLSRSETPSVKPDHPPPSTASSPH